ncbi:hypothetical protein TPHA_0D03420 [Tetrapisispora phaffii CBS 4417]|uniref:Histone H2A.Z-specific chaperone CHZ1 n=1 Tax=Tetrapisispora phaffii (strain ATCC 24235 / CBS 4417 / NBRC 1672 / NRRL Y-8282 / UCD 70-5) TaxID=1071381 RepID=G8BT06_TETPH|nr:hypothetical protein TPHA_0D03420 [Tetrapisispora phaffii CBS 4417]CCE62977.1 hypothetical protein TPHA_0D03420 [Tetrapisispora phaffii CBS 4417]
MAEEKRKLENESEVVGDAKTVSEKATEPVDTNSTKTKQKRRRRNYDDYDAEVNKDEEKSKEESKTDDFKGEGDEDEISDERLDAMITLEDEFEDDLAEIDTSNIITTGRRTRGKIIDYKKTAEKLDASTGKSAALDNENDEDEDEDVDFKE